MQGTAVTFALARHSAGWRFSDLTQHCRVKVRHALLEWVAVTLPGAQQPLVHLLADDAREQGGHAQATVVGHGFATSTRQAALVNAAASQASSGDDAAQAPASAALLPALLALAEARGDSGRAFMTAFAAGHDLLDRIGAHCPGAPALAAAAACAHLLQLDAHDTAAALAMAGSSTSSAADMCEPLQAGKAAADGLLAAELAARGCSQGIDALAAPMRAFLPRQDAAGHTPHELALRQQQLEARFHQLAEPVLDEADRQALLRLISQLEELPDLSPLAGVLAARPASRH